MHELSITQNIVDIASRYAGTNRVRVVRIEIGKLSAISPEALSFCFDVCKEGTTLSEATLEIAMIDATAGCRQCGKLVRVDDPPWKCICGSEELNLLSGLEMKLKDMEIV